VKLIGVYTKSHRILKDEWFLASLQDNYDVELHNCDIAGSGTYMEPSWSEAVLFKSDTIINSIKKYWGEIFVYSDVDVQFFKPTQQILLNAIKNYDIVCQRDDPYGNLCTGFWIARANEKVLKLWQEIRAILKQEKRDQFVFNRIIREKPMGGKIKRIFNYFMRIFMGKCRYSYFPVTFFGGGTITGKLWTPGTKISVPEGIVLHHANCTIGVENKIRQLKYVRGVVETRQKNNVKHL